MLAWEGQNYAFIDSFMSKTQMLCQLLIHQIFPHCTAKLLRPGFCHQCSFLLVDDVIKKYKHAKSNLDELQKLGACLLHGVDATKMKFHSDLQMRRFDRVIFNFPHAGFHGKEDNLLLIK